MSNENSHRFLVNIVKNIEITPENPSSMLLSLIKQGFKCGSICLLPVSSIAMGLYTFFFLNI